METKESCLSHIAELRADMIQKDWIITAFRAVLNGIECVVVMEIYCEQNPRPKEKERFVACTLYFHDVANPGRILTVNANSAKLYSQDKIREFFGFSGWQNENPWPNFYAAFNRQIPTAYILPTGQCKNLAAAALASRIAERHNPHATECYKVMRLGKKNNGESKHRTPENDQLARLMCSSLYEKLCADMDDTFSFCFREPNPNIPKPSDEQILLQFGDHI